MTICPVNKRFENIEIEYTASSKPSTIPTHILAPEIQSGYPLYPETEEIQNGWHIIKPKEAVNLVCNPTFFVDLDFWDNINSQILRTNEWAFDQGFSMRISGSGVIPENILFLETSDTVNYPTNFFPGNNQMTLIPIDIPVGEDLVVTKIGTHIRSVSIPTLLKLDLYDPSLNLLNEGAVQNAQVGLNESFMNSEIILNNGQRYWISVRVSNSGPVELIARFGSVPPGSTEPVFKDKAFVAFNDPAPSTITGATNQGLYLYGAAQLHSIVSNRSYAETEICNFEAGSTYVFSGYLWTPAIWDNQDPALLTLSIIDYDGVTYQEIFSERLEKHKTWKRLAVSKKIRDTAIQVFARVNLRSQPQKELVPPFNPTGFFNLRNELFFVDMLQFELGLEPTTPFHGDYETCLTKECCCNSYKWLGTPHKSTSFRDGCTRDGGILTSLSSLGFEILEHTNHGAAPVRDISFSYSSISGGEYQKSVVDENVISLLGYVCEKSLIDLEKKIFNLKNLSMPNIGIDKGKLLLVYIHNTCDNLECDPERYLAYCVTYIGGLEGIRNNLNQQRLTLQFKAHNPFAFEWPGHSSKRLSISKVIQNTSLIKVDEDGNTRGFPITPNLDITGIACLQGKNHFVIAGEFNQIYDGECDPNVAVFNCDKYVTTGGVVGGKVNTLINDLEGNVIIGGAFQGFLRKFYSVTDNIGFFENYPGGEVFSLASSFWAELVVGTANSIFFGIRDNFGNLIWTSFVTNGKVHDLLFDSQGSLYAAGEFTEIDGEEFFYSAKYNINSTGCFSLDEAKWESIGFSFDDPIFNMAYCPDTETFYFAGDAKTITPDPVETCEVLGGDIIESRGNPISCNESFLANWEDVFSGPSPSSSFNFSTSFGSVCDVSCVVNTDFDFEAPPPPGFLEVINLVNGGIFLSMSFSNPVTNLEIEIDEVHLDEQFSNFNVFPTAVSGDLIIDGANVRSTVNPGSGKLIWNIPVSFLSFEYNETGPIVNNRILLQTLAFDSVSALQQMRFQDLGAGIYRYEIRVTNILVQNEANTCTTTAPDEKYIRVTGNSSGGSAYSFLFGPNIVSTSQGVVSGLFTFSMDIDTSILIDEPCLSLNSALVNEYNQAISDLILFSTINLPGGIGIDNTLRQVNVQCIQVIEEFQGESTTFNEIICLRGNSVERLQDGLPTSVTSMQCHPCTKQLWVGMEAPTDTYTNGLAIWTGQQWLEFPGNVGGPGETEIKDIDFCENSCSTYILFENNGNSLIFDTTKLDYKGSVESEYFDIVIHGQGDIHYFEQAQEKKKLHLCTKLQTNEIATLRFGFGDFTSNFRKTLSQTILPSSRIDLVLNKCDNNFNLLVTNTDSCTSATIIYRNRFWGVEALCAKEKEKGPIFTTKCCNVLGFNKDRNPTDLDCSDKGWFSGDVWVNQFECNRVFVNVGEGCQDLCSTEKVGFVSESGEVIQDDNNNNLCQDECEE